MYAAFHEGATNGSVADPRAQADGSILNIKHPFILHKQACKALVLVLLRSRDSQIVRQFTDVRSPQLVLLTSNSRKSHQGSCLNNGDSSLYFNLHKHVNFKFVTSYTK